VQCTTRGSLIDDVTEQEEPDQSAERVLRLQLSPHPGVVTSGQRRLPDRAQHGVHAVDGVVAQCPTQPIDLAGRQQRCMG
jgi:hypothetical protein